MHSYLDLSLMINIFDFNLKGAIQAKSQLGQALSTNNEEGGLFPIHKRKLPNYRCINSKENHKYITILMHT